MYCRYGTVPYLTIAGSAGGGYSSCQADERASRANCDNSLHTPGQPSDLLQLAERSTTDGAAPLVITPRNLRWTAWSSREPGQTPRRSQTRHQQERVSLLTCRCRGDESCPAHITFKASRWECRWPNGEGGEQRHQPNCPATPLSPHRTASRIATHRQGRCCRSDAGTTAVAAPQGTTLSCRCLSTLRSADGELDTPTPTWTGLGSRQATYLTG